MQNDEITIRYMTKKPYEYSPKSKSSISYSTIDQSNQPAKSFLRHIYIKLILSGILISSIYLLISQKTNVISPMNTNIPVQQKLNQTKPNAFIITADCQSLRYKITKQNIEISFPNYFNIICFPSVSLNDSRIHTGPISIVRKFSSNLLSFVDLWTYEIPKHLQYHNEYKWSFIFEDDVNFNNATTLGLLNYIEPLEDLIHNSEVKLKDGFIYLGICGPTFDNNSQSLISKNTNNSLISQRGYGYCLHATAITVKRARLFWSEISSYRPNSPDSALDLQVRDYSIRSKQHYYTFGSNFLYPPGTGHYGIAFQDRGRFSTTVT